MKHALLLLLLATSAGAAEPDADAGEDAGLYEPESSDDKDLEARVAALEETLAQTKAVTERLSQQLEAASAVQVQFSGYIDVGFFWAAGDGSGVRPDYRHLVPGTEDLLTSWVLIGDPLSTAINSRGDVADLGRLARHSLRPDSLAGPPELPDQRAQPGAERRHSATRSSSPR